MINRHYYTLQQAADSLSKLHKETVTVSDVLHLGATAQLTLSIDVRKAIERSIHYQLSFYDESKVVLFARHSLTASYRPVDEQLDAFRRRLNQWVGLLDPEMMGWGDALKMKIDRFANPTPEELQAMELEDSFISGEDCYGSYEDVSGLTPAMAKRLRTPTDEPVPQLKLTARKVLERYYRIKVVDLFVLPNALENYEQHYAEEANEQKGKNYVSENTQANVIAAFYDLFLVENPQANKSTIKDIFAAKYKNLRGLSERTLDKVLDEAEQIRNTLPEKR